MRAVATGGRAGKARHHKFLQRRKERKKEGNEGGGRTSSDTVRTRADRKSRVRQCLFFCTADFFALVCLVIS